jgi:hypothetical protein
MYVGDTGHIVNTDPAVSTSTGVVEAMPCTLISPSTTFNFFEWGSIRTSTVVVFLVTSSTGSILNEISAAKTPRTTHKVQIATIPTDLRSIDMRVDFDMIDTWDIYFLANVGLLPH